MSNITPAEIVTLVADDFGITVAALKAPHSAHARRALRSNPAYTAWKIAAALIDRHTTASLQAAAGALGRKTRSTFREANADAVAWFERAAAHDAALGPRIASIEDAIEAIHEGRVEAESGSTGPGAVGEAVALGNQEGRP